MKPAASTRAVEWALLGGNFAIGCGVMVAAGCLNDLVQDLDVSVAKGGQVITLAAVCMCFGAPLLAATLGGWDRRKLLTWALLWFGVGHLISALAPGYSSLLVLRGITVLGAAVFTPQAAAAMGAMAAPERRGRAITFIFLGWSLSSVLGMPLHAYIGEAFGWRWAFALVGVFALVAAVAVWRAMPSGLVLPPLSLASWRGIFSHPMLMGLVAVTALAGAGQFTIFAYLAPYMRQLAGAGAADVSLIFFWFGAFGLIGNMILSRVIDRLGAAKAVSIGIALMALSLAIWPLAQTMQGVALVALPWALGGFASNSAQQARSMQASPAWASALVALNTSAIYLGQAVGAASGGALIAGSGFGLLSTVALGWMMAALILSLWLGYRMRGGGGGVAHG